MLFTTLINEICPGTSIKILHAEDIFNLSDVAFLDGTQKEYEKEILYFGYAEQLAGQKLPPQCVLARGEGEISLQQETSLALVEAHELFRAFNAAKAVLDASRSQGFYGEMLDCAARSQSIEPIINLAAAKLGNSLVLLDPNFKILACSTIFPIDDPLWEEYIRLGYCTYEFVSAVQNIEAVKNAAQNSDPVVVTCYASPLRKLSSKIYIRGIFAGIVLMLEKETPISPAHLKLLPVISAAAGEAISRYAPYLIPDNTVYQKLLYDLLIGAPPEEIAPQLTGLKFSPHLCALCIRQSRYLGQKHVKEVAKHLVRLLPDTRFTFHEKGIGALVPLKEAPGLSADMAGCLDYAFYDLLDATREPEKLGLYCHPALALLSRYDHVNGTDLYHTLETYLACGCSVKDTAEKLYIHRNSLNYRLDRIQSLTQVELGASRVRFLLEMSYQIDHFTRRDA